MNRLARLVILVLACFAAGSVAVAAQPKRAPRRTAASSAVSPHGALNTPTLAKTIAYSSRDVARIRTKVRYTTLIVLPKQEVILDYVCGDKDLWVINGEQNLAYIKPAKENSQTNLNLITESGNVYSFVLAEITGVQNEEPDLKVFVELKETAMTEAVAGPRRFVSAQELDDARQQAEKAKEETRRTQDNSNAAVEAGIKRFVSNVRFAYRFEAGKKPFYVRAMYHDDRFTYIQARPEETPTLYELKDGKPSLVNFDYKDGVYVVDKILDDGYLAVGDKRLRFYREE